MSTTITIPVKRARRVEERENAIEIEAAFNRHGELTIRPGTDIVVHVTAYIGDELQHKIFTIDDGQIARALLRLFDTTSLTCHHCGWKIGQYDPVVVRSSVPIDVATSLHEYDAHDDVKWQEHYERGIGTEFVICPRCGSEISRGERHDTPV